MTVASVNAGGDFRVGDVLSRAWHILTGNILFFLAVPFVIYVITVVGAVIFVLVFAFVGWASNTVGVIVVGAALAVILVLSLNMIGQGLMLLGAFQRLRGQPLRVGEAVRRVLARFVPLVLLGIVWTLALFIVTAISVAVLAGLGSLSVVAAVVLSPAFLVPTITLLVMWSVVAPACIVEGLGPIASMFRSTDLTKGHRWKVFGIVFLLIVLALVGPILQMILAPISEGLATLVGTICFVAWSAYWNCVIIMTYHDLRVAKEGIDTEQIAAIFD